MAEKEDKPSSEDEQTCSKVKAYTTKKGYFYEAYGKLLGPFSIKDHDATDFKDKLAIELDVEPKDILRAELINSQRPITIDEILDILSSTIKQDNPTKAILFLTMLATYTEEAQQNIALQAESASGKSYIPLELASYFPDEDKIIIASASPTAFFHETGTLVDENGQPINFLDRPPRNASPEEKSEWNKRLKNSRILVNLERKILIFLDQPHYMLMEKLRSLLSHDQKELQYKITDKTQRFGLRTKNVIIRGYPTIIFCSTKLKLDEQEKTRVFLLSPEVAEEKLLESIYLLGEKFGNRDRFRELLKSDARRLWLRNRVHSIRTAGIRDVVIDDWKNVCKKFIKSHPNLAPRHQRDFPRLIALIKSHALLNWVHRESLPDKRIKANSEDIEAGFKLYNQIAKQNELGLSPQLYEIYQKVIEPLLDPEEGIDRRSILNLAERLALNPSEVSEVSEISVVLRDVGVATKTVNPAYSQTTRTTQTSPIDNFEPLLRDLISRLRRSFSRGEFYIEDVWINWFQNQGCSQERAEAYFNELRGKDFFYGDKGWALG